MTRRRDREPREPRRPRPEPDRPRRLPPWMRPTGREIPIIPGDDPAGGRTPVSPDPLPVRRPSGRQTADPVTHFPPWPDPTPDPTPPVVPGPPASPRGTYSERTYVAPSTVLDQVIPMVYGSAKVNGYCAAWNTSASYIDLAFVLCFGEQAALGSIEINDEAIGTLGWVYDYDVFLGSGSGTRPTYMAFVDTTPWLYMMNFCTVTVRIRAKDAQCPGSFNLSAVPTGRKFAAFRSPYTNTNHTNLGEIAYDILTAAAWKGLSPAPAGIEAGGTWEKFADQCDEVMGDTSKRYTFNGIISERDPDRAIDLVLQAGFAEKYFSADGKIQIWSERPPDAISGTWTASSSTVNGSGGAALSELATDDIVFVGSTPCIVVSVVTDNQFTVDRTVTETSVKTRLTSGVYLKLEDWFEMPEGREVETGSIPDEVRVRYTLSNYWGSMTYPTTATQDRRIEVTVEACNNASMARRISETKKNLMALQPHSWQGVAHPVAAALEPGDIFFFDDDVLTFQPARVLPTVTSNRAGNVVLSFQQYAINAVSDSTQVDPTIPTQPTAYQSGGTPHFSAINSVTSGGVAYNFLQWSGSDTILGDDLVINILDGISIRLPNDVALLAMKDTLQPLQAIKCNGSNQLELGDGTVPIYLNSSSLIGKNEAMIQYDHASPKNALTWSVTSSLMQLGNSSAQLNIFGDDITIGQGSIDITLWGATTILGASSSVEIETDGVPLRGYCGALGVDLIKTNSVSQNKVIVGDSTVQLWLKGTASRPDYMGTDLALYTDIIDPAGTYLPLTAGSGSPLTGDLYLTDKSVYFKNNYGIYMQETGLTYRRVFYMGPTNNDINVGNANQGLRFLGDETRPKYNNNDLALLTDAGGGPGTDTTAIHRTLANEITLITNKGTVVDADEFVIEDSGASYVKKAVLASVIATYVETKLGLSSRPFLPLTAGGSYPLTNHLYIQSADDPTILLREGGDTVNYGRIVHSATAMYFDGYRASGNSSLIYFRAFTGSITDASYIRFNYGVNAQACYYQFYGPNGTAEVARITGTASNSGYVTAYANGGTAALQAWWDSSNYCALQTISASTTYLRRYGTASPTIQIFCTAVAGTENCAVGIGYATNTTGTNRLLLYDNATVIHEFDLNSGDIDLCKTGGTLCVGDYDHELHTTGNADLCQNGGKLMVNTADLATMVSTTLEVGDTSLTLNLQGAGSRPQFEGSALALYSDLSSSPSVHDPDAIHYNETFEFSEASYLAGANIADLDIILLEDSGTKKYTTFEDIGIYLNNTYAQFLNRYGDVNPGMLGVLSFETYSASVGGIRMKDSSNNWRTVAHMNTATMYLGTTACNLEIEAGTYLDMTATYTRVFGGFGATGEVEHQGNVTLFNNKFFRVQNTPGGTAYNVIGMNGSNQVVVGNSTYTMYLYSSGASFQCSVDVNGTLHVTNDLHVFQTLEIDGTAQFDSTTTFNSFIIQEYNKNFSIKDSGGTARGVMVVTGSNFRLGYDTLMTSIRGIGGGTSSPFSSGHWGIWKKSSDNTVWLVYNDGGTAKMVELTSTPHAEGI